MSENQETRVSTKYVFEVEIYSNKYLSTKQLSEALQRSVEDKSTQAIVVFKPTPEIELPNSSATDERSVARDFASH